jgi:hypothetical protein
MTAQFEQLVKTVVVNSESNKWIDAKNEWNVVNISEDESAESQCICGKENLRYLYTIKNTLNGNTLFPIGSECIKQFNQEALNNDVTTYRKLLKLQQAVENNEFISLDSTYFSRNLLSYLYQNGAFKPNKYNNNDPEEDYEFLLSIFNKRKPLDVKYQNKIKALIINAIIPFAKEKVKMMKNYNKLTLDDLKNWVDDDSVGYVLGGENEFTFESPDGKEICVNWVEQDDNDYGDINILLDSDPASFLYTSIDDAYNRNSIDFNNPECQDLISKLSTEIGAEIASCINEKIVDTYSYLLK